MKDFTPLLTVSVPDEKEPQTVCWSWERPGGGRSFGFSGGHFLDNWRRLEYQRLFAQGILWTLKIQPPEKDFPTPLAAEEPLLRLTGKVIEQGQPVAARVYLQGDSGRWFFPKSAAEEGTAIAFQRDTPDTKSVEMHTTLSALPVYHRPSSRQIHAHHRAGKGVSAAHQAVHNRQGTSRFDA